MRYKAQMPSNISDEAAKNPLGAIIRASGITRQEAADLLYISVHTVNAWLRPSNQKSALEFPRWAPELLAYKLKDRARLPGNYPEMGTHTFGADPLGDVSVNSGAKDIVGGAIEELGVRDDFGPWPTSNKGPRRR